MIPTLKVAFTTTVGLSARQAFLVVPMVGAFPIDLTNSAIITAFANWMK